MTTAFISAALRCASADGMLFSAFGSLTNALWLWGCRAAAAAAGPDGVVAPDALPDPTAVIWQWYGDPAGTPADMLQIEEFRPLVARLAQVREKRSLYRL